MACLWRLVGRTICIALGGAKSVLSGAASAQRLRALRLRVRGPCSSGFLQTDGLFWHLGARPLCRLQRHSYHANSGPFWPRSANIEVQSMSGGVTVTAPIFAQSRAAPAFVHGSARARRVGPLQLLRLPDARVCGGGGGISEAVSAPSPQWSAL